MAEGSPEDLPTTGSTGPAGSDPSSDVSAAIPPTEVMHEAEVCLRLAIYLISEGLVSGKVTVSLDGAHEKVRDRVIFGVDGFMAAEGWTRCDSPGRTFTSSECPDGVIELIRRPGVGDVTAVLKDGMRLFVEAKGGRLTRSPSNPENALMREAIGQLVTSEDVENVVLVVAVPDGDGFRSRIEKWKGRPLIKQLGIRLVTVSQSGEVRGLA